MSPRLELGLAPRLGYTGSLLNRAVQRRADDTALTAWAEDAATRSYVFGGDAVVLCRTPQGGFDPLFVPAAARKLGPLIESAFLGLHDGAARFALALEPAAAEA